MMVNKMYHLFIGSETTHGAYEYRDSFLEVHDAYQFFVEIDPGTDGYIMMTSDDGSLVRSHDINLRDLVVFPERTKYSLADCGKS